MLLLIILLTTVWEWRNRLTKTEKDWSVLIICCWFWQRFKRHGWTLWRSPQTIRENYPQHKSHPGLSICWQVYALMGALILMLLLLCPSQIHCSRNTKAKDNAKAYLTETQWHADAIWVNLYAKHWSDSYHTEPNGISIIFMWGRRYEKHTCKGTGEIISILWWTDNMRLAMFIRDM